MRFGKNFLDAIKIAVESETLTVYKSLYETDFSSIESFTLKEIENIFSLHSLYLHYTIEERRMHFGALALISLCTVILLPFIFLLNQYIIPLSIIELLLVLLLIPYVFVYRNYENRVRSMMVYSIILKNGILAKSEK